MIDVDEAYRVLFSLVKPGPAETLTLDDGLHRTLAEPVTTDLDAPPFDRAVMDGYAVRAADVAGAPVRLRVAGYSAAGGGAARALAAGEAVKINTGAPLPGGADAVVRVEDTESASGDGVKINVSVTPETFVTRRGSYMAAGDVVLPAGARLTPAAIGAAASAGAARVTVYAKPRVAILSTGDELVDVDCVPTGAQIRDSNRELLGALVRAAHAEAVVLPPVADDRDTIEAAVRQGLASDVLCVTGGVSMGDRDFVPGVLESVGATIHVQRVAIKPGRPTIFASDPAGALIFALPGNPVSAFVAFALFVRPALAVLEGRPAARPRYLPARLTGSVPKSGDRTSFWPGLARVDERGQWQVERLSWGGSGDALGLARANTMIVRDAGMPEAADGAPVTIMPLDGVWG